MQLLVRVVYLHQFHPQFVHIAHLLLVDPAVFIHLVLAALKFRLGLLQLLLLVAQVLSHLFRMLHFRTKLSLKFLQLVQQRDLVLFAIHVLQSELV